MAYPGNYGLSSPGVGEDYDALAPDYEPDTLPYPRQRRSEADRDRVPPDQFDRNGYLADRRGSGEYDNRAFEGGGFEDRNMNMYNGQARHPTVSQMDRFDVIEVERDYDMDGRQDYRQPDNRREYDDMDDRQNYRQPDYRREYDDMDDRQNYRQPDYRREYDDMDDRHGYSPRDYHPHDAVEMAAGHYNPRNGVRHRGRHSAHGIENRAFTHDGEEVSDYHQVPRRRFSPRRTKSRRERRKSHRDRGRDRDLDTDHEDDRDSVDTIVPPDVTSEDYQRTMDFLATIRVKSRRKRKSLKRPHSDHIDHEAGQESEEDDDEEGEVGLPSQRAHPKPKSLTERLLEAKQQSTTEAANAIRDSVWIDAAIRGTGTKPWEKRWLAIKDSLGALDLWAHHFKEIEGRFGSAVSAYLRFIRWLFFLNLFTFIVSFCVIIVPYWATTYPPSFEEAENPDGPNSTLANSSWLQAQHCTENYYRSLTNNTLSLKIPEQALKVLDFFIGTGWMEKTTMFYGTYHNRTFNHGTKDSYNYNMGLAYLLSMVAIFLVSFILIVTNSSQAVKDAIRSDEEHSSVHFTNSVLCGWDFCINNEKSARDKKRILVQEFKADLTEQSKRMERLSRTGKQKLIRFLIRLIINILILAMLGGCLFLIYYTTNKLLELRKVIRDPLLMLVVQFVPSMTITVLNYIMPVVFDVLVAVEDYLPATSVKVTLVRWVLLRLSSLGVLLVALYYTLQVEDDEAKIFNCPEEGTTSVTRCCSNLMWSTSDQNGTSALSDVKCWETYLGQQFYKLCIVDYAVLFLKTFLVEFPRKFLFDRFKERFSLVAAFGQQFFDLPENVLDIVYSQAISWLGMFFAPLLPAMTLLKVIIIFYLKKLTLVYNYAPPQYAYKASKSNSFFMTILLISFILCTAVVGYMIGNLHPSKSCGPFRVYSRDDYVMWHALTDEISRWPAAASDFFFFFGTPAFFVPAFLVLCLMMYCYWAVAQGYRKMESILREQLKMEGKDKQFLLARVNDIIKYGNLRNPDNAAAFLH